MKNPLFVVKNSEGREVSIVCWTDDLATISADLEPTAAVTINKNMAKQIAEYLLTWVNDTK